MGIHVRRILGGAALVVALAGRTSAPPPAAPAERTWDDIPYSSPAGGA